MQSRRSFMVATAGGFAAALSTNAMAQKVRPGDELKPGEWVWYPERSQYGPVAIVVSLSDQLAFVYRNGIRIGATTVFDRPPGL